MVVKDRSQGINEEGEAVCKVKNSVQKANDKTLDGLVDVCKLEDGEVSEVIVIPNGLRQRMFWLPHDHQAYVGSRKVGHMKENYIWQGMFK